MKIRPIRQVLNEAPLHINHTHFGYFMITKHFCKKGIVIVNHIYFRVIWVTFLLGDMSHIHVSFEVPATLYNIYFSIIIPIYIKFIIVLLCWASGWIAHITPPEARKYGLVSGKGTIFINAAISRKDLKLTQSVHWVA